MENIQVELQEENDNVIVVELEDVLKGKDGFSPIAKVTQTLTGATITITDETGTTSVNITNGTNGKDGVDGTTPVKGIDYFTIADKVEIETEVKNNIEIPENLSELNNDSGFITEDYTYTKQEIDNKISDIPKFSIKVVQELPKTDISETTVYLVVSGDEETNLYDEYIYVDNKWEKLGTQEVDLTGVIRDTDYATSSTGGIVKFGGSLGIGLSSTNNVQASTYNYETYSNKGNNVFISKGTLENIKTKYVKEALESDEVQAEILNIINSNIPNSEEVEF